MTLVSPLVFRIFLRLNFACLDRSKLWTAAPLDTPNRTFGLDNGDENANNYFTDCTILYYSMSYIDIFTATNGLGNGLPFGIGGRIFSCWGCTVFGILTSFWLILLLHLTLFFFFLLAELSLNIYTRYFCLRIRGRFFTFLLLLVVIDKYWPKIARFKFLAYTLVS